MKKKDNNLFWLIIAIIVGWYLIVKKNIFKKENIDYYNNSDSKEIDSNGNVHFHYGNDKGGIDVGVNLFN